MTGSPRGIFSSERSAGPTLRDKGELVKMRSHPEFSGVFVGACRHLAVYLFGICMPIHDLKARYTRKKNVGWSWRKVLSLCSPVTGKSFLFRFMFRGSVTQSFSCWKLQPILALVLCIKIGKYTCEIQAFPKFQYKLHILNCVSCYITFMPWFWTIYIWKTKDCILS